MIWLVYVYRRLLSLSRCFNWIVIQIYNPTDEHVLLLLLKYVMSWWRNNVLWKNVVGDTLHEPHVFIFHLSMVGDSREDFEKKCKVSSLFRGIVILVKFCTLATHCFFHYTSYFEIRYPSFSVAQYFWFFPDINYVFSFWYMSFNKLVSTWSFFVLNFFFSPSVLKTFSTFNINHYLIYIWIFKFSWINLFICHVTICHRRHQLFWWFRRYIYILKKVIIK